MPQITVSHRTDHPLIRINMISHGTLTSLDLQASRRFYEEVLGFDVIQVSPASMLARKGTDHVYVIVETGKPSTMGVFDHNGIDVATREAVDDAHATLTKIRDEYGLRRINPALDQHGAYSFYFCDHDGNWWEIVHARPRGYASLFDDPARDLTGRTTVDPDLLEHTGSDGYADSLRRLASPKAMIRRRTRSSLTWPTPRATRSTTT
jgi:catechol 2,3-dioxygenase-like lactoylglutathione lyase family enzyme